MPYHHLHQWSTVSDLWDPSAAVSAPVRSPAQRLRKAQSMPARKQGHGISSRAILGNTRTPESVSAVAEMAAPPFGVHSQQ